MGKKASTGASGNQSSRTTAAVLLHDTAQQRAFRGAEKLYLDVVAIKNAARDMYSETSVLETVQKVVDMYETNTFFESERANKIAAVTTLFREGRRRGTI